MPSGFDLNYPLQTLALNFTTNGDNIAIAAVAGQIIRVYGIEMAGATATAVKFTDGAGGTVFFGPATLTSLTLDRFFDNRPRYQCTAGNAFIINIGAGNQFGGSVFFTQGVN